MCTCKTAIRRRKQAAKNYRHMDPKRRPHYPGAISRTKSEAKLQRIRELNAKGIRV